MTRGSGTRRGAALAALGLGVLALVYVLSHGTSPYVVHARFTSASQIVKGARVEVAGEQVGTVRSVKLGPRWSADVAFEVDAAHAPLRAGTTATIRQVSLSGVASRYVDLTMPPGTRQRTLPNGGVISLQDTNPVVDVDQLFDTLGPRERAGLRHIVRGFGEQIDGSSAQANAGFAYLDPVLATNARLFGQLTRDQPALERFVVSSSRLATDVAERRDELAGLVDQLAEFVGTLATRRTDLGRSLHTLPTFLRRANTTFVNLRSTLDDLQPTLQQARPVARRLGPVLAQLRPFAHEARPTLRDLARAISAPGGDNDLVELTRSAVPVRDQLVRSVQRNGKRRRGTLSELANALRGQINGFTDLRPYTPDLIGWFDDFSHTGLVDANGSASRTSLVANAFANVDGVLTPIPPSLREQAFQGLASLAQDNRCPGAGEHVAADHSNPYRPTPAFNCDPTQLLPGR